MNESGWKLLILGQRIGISDAEGRSLKQLFCELHNWPDETRLPRIGEPSGTGKPYVKPSVSWLTALDLTIGGNSPLFQLQALFQDPERYALRIVPSTGVLSGAEIEITYRRLDDRRGVYQTEFQLPSHIRQFMVSGFTITFPHIGVEIHTNGDFLLDIGFPWNLDFSRSFSIEGYVAPGIPVLGSAGFYIGRLKDPANSVLPTHNLGTFGPMTTFGLGMQIGLGKSFQVGPLKAGFSLTAVGMLEGIIAPWHTSDMHNAEEASTLHQWTAQDEYYYWVRGMAGLVGKLFGTVDFSLIKADVHVDLSLLSQVTIEAYRKIPISVYAEVDVSASVKIGWKRFSRTFHFSYAADLHESFLIETNEDAPWERNKRLLPPPSETPSTMYWDRLMRPNERMPLHVHFVPVMTVDGETAATPSLTALLMIEAPDPGAGPDSDNKVTSLQLLAEKTVIWLLAASLPSSVSERDMLQAEVSLEELHKLHDLVADSTVALPLPPENLEALMEQQFEVWIHADACDGDSSCKTEPMSFFPMIPRLSLLVPNNPPVDFAEHNKLKLSSLQAFRRQLDLIRIRYETEFMECTTDGPLLPTDDIELSAATWEWADYFRGISSYMLQSCIDAYPKLPERPPKVPLSRLLSELSDSEKYRHLAGLLNRQFLHGLRYSSENIDMGLYRLTGQQFELPPSPDEHYVFHLQAPEDLNWVRFD